MTFQRINGIAAGFDCPVMGHPVPPWDAVEAGIVYYLNMYSAKEPGDAQTRG
jgi:hypothetical protein